MKALGLMLYRERDWRNIAITLIDPAVQKTWDRDLWCAPFENREECGSLDGVGEKRVGQPPSEAERVHC
jgi:hypothetical protein